MNYHPAGMYVWDTWYFSDQDTVHCIHLQQPRDNIPPGIANGELDRERGALGHAVSDDLISWKTLPTALYRSEPGQLDDLDLWTGSVVKKDNTFYLFYTARCSREKGTVQRIFLAISSDAIHWERWGYNPVISPDSTWYHGEKNPRYHTRALWPTVDCRDLCVVKDPQSDWYYGYFAARRPASETARTAVIGLARSRNLSEWEQLPPCFTPDRYACVETPDVFELDGLWYLLVLTGNGYGQRNRTAEANLGGPATVFAVAEKPEGPFVEPENNVLIGSERRQTFCARTVEFKGERYLLSTQAEEVSGSPWGTISFPKKLSVNKDGKLALCFADNFMNAYIENQFSGFANVPRVNNPERYGNIGDWNIADDGLRGTCRSDYSLYVLRHESRNILCEVTINPEGCRSSGIVLRLNSSSLYQGAYFILLDYEEQQVVFYKGGEFERFEGRKWSLLKDGKTRLKVLSVDATFEVYVDNLLVLQLHHPDYKFGRAGLFVEQGSAMFSDFSMSVVHPDRQL
jgi:beta-fructofuranosidase